MAKYYGVIGFTETVETEPDLWEDDIKEYHYAGDLVRNSRRLESSNGTLDNINISNVISILADPYARENFHNIRYAEFRGTKWKVSNVEDKYPRLELTLGGVYNVE